MRYRAAMALFGATLLLIVACGGGTADEPTTNGESADTTEAPPATEAPPTTDATTETTESTDTTQPDTGGLECDEPRTLSYATSLGTDSAYYAGAVALKEAAEELSGGCITIEIFADAALGTDRDMIEGMQLGSIDMASPSTGAMGSVLPEPTLLDLPYLFDDFEHVYCVLDGPIGSEDIYSMFDGVGFHPLGYWEIGFRDLTNNVRPVQTPADVEGLTLRTLPSNVHQTAWSLVGAQPVAMDFTELYNALDTGVVDGQENPLNIIITGNLYEVQKYLSLTNHVYGTAPTSISDMTWESLSPEEQAILKEAVAISTEAQREAASGDLEAQLQQLRDAGMEIIEDPDRDAFREAMQPSWSDYTDQYPENQELIDRIRAAADEC
jgi:tripartite ATP-independent transporter DctP family solute receptor